MPFRYVTFGAQENCPVCASWEGVESEIRAELPPAPNPDCMRPNNCECLVIHFADGEGGGGGGGGDSGDSGGGGGDGGDGTDDGGGGGGTPKTICNYFYEVFIEDERVSYGYAYYFCDQGRQ